MARRLAAAEKNEIAFKVALGWLKFASKCIADGRRPIKLSASGYEAVRDHFVDLSENGDNRAFPSKNQITEIAALAIQEAKRFFYHGQFQDVKKYFTRNIDGTSPYFPESKYEEAAQS